MKGLKLKDREAGEIWVNEREPNGKRNYRFVLHNASGGENYHCIKRQPVGSPMVFLNF